MKRLLKEPLLHFLLIGAGLFLLFNWRSGPASLPGGQTGPESARIVVGQGDINQMVETFTRTWQRPPTDKEIAGLVESLIRDEIYYREAMAIGLDRDDSVIRRRLRLKMEYIFEDIAAQGEPTETELEIFFRKNGGKYLLEPQIAFRHVFISVDKRGENAETYSRQLLAELNNGVDPSTVGDPILPGPEIGLSSLRDIKSQFGEHFAESLLELQPGSWQGPLPSEFGLHLVFINDRKEERLPELHEVLENVKRDWAAERQRELKDAAYARLRERYLVEIEEPKSETAGVDDGTGKVVSR